MEYLNELVKHNNNSISSITTPGQIVQGKMTLISEQTASGSASISFTSGIDSTYPIYKFEFINIHPATDNVNFQVNFRDGGSLYDAVKTTTIFRTYHAESDAEAGLDYENREDLAQSTSSQVLGRNIGSDADQSTSGSLTLFNPSSTTYVKHFIANSDMSNYNNYQLIHYVAGYCNTTTAIDGVQFSMSSGNFDGTIKLYGIGD
jgi:hypothetical protein